MKHRRLADVGIRNDPMRWSSMPAQMPFLEAPCAVHAHTGGEVPASTELHHIFPLYLQKAAGIPDASIDADRIPLCGSGHSDVHFAITAILSRRPVPHGVGRKELALAQEAVELYRSFGGK